MTTPTGTPWSDPVASGWERSSLDTGVPQPSRIYDYWIGGKDNFAADREVAEAMTKTAPEIPGMARANRAFLGRAVKHLAEQGVRQFLDIGTGLPAAGNTHEVAQAVAPDAKVVYVDNDPMVAVHGGVMLAGNRNTRVFQADLRAPDTILSHPDVTSLLDFSRPVGLLFVAVLHFIPEEDEPYALVQRFKDVAVAGSHLVISHMASDIHPLDTAPMESAYKNTSSGAIRDHKEITAFFDGFDLVDPGLVQVPVWRPDGPIPENLDKYWIYGGVGRKDA